MTDPHEDISNDDMLINMDTSFQDDEHMEDVFLESLLNDVIVPFKGAPVLAEDYIVIDATTDSMEVLFDDAMVVQGDGFLIVPLEGDPVIDLPSVDEERHNYEQCRLARHFGPAFPGSLTTSSSTVFVNSSVRQL
ncbi:hypothetical protein PHYBOEH_009068 [Phytophthora boehmeriae]|uniref:Uncharacterized protein n=1 Tax=Phytophthora boehmeriae TaxID=109152 RepID=A0A8T1VVU7_9STRA|nr:hypothetical protein PHYBOEH_009068 [Phytophthora boehmeriae]